VDCAARLGLSSPAGPGLSIRPSGDPWERQTVIEYEIQETPPERATAASDLERTSFKRFNHFKRLHLKFMPKIY